ncbi:MAG TPA: NAD(P)-binding domain-containing protein [Marmoricola sp.]|nr:NAD(P)-binding domain-containing protein [Marmoricola sp.]
MDTTTTRLDTLVIGAGQAGLCTGYHLKRAGREFLIVDGHDRLGDNWRNQWDTLRLFTPARMDGLPGLRFPGDPTHYPSKDEVGDYLETFARHHQLPVRLGTRVLSLEKRGDVFVATTDTGTFVADSIVVCTGSFGRTPLVPDAAADLAPGIVQLHSSAYRRPDQLAEGPVLVVGASHSGQEIAYELALTRSTTLCGRDTGALPFNTDSRRGRAAFPLVLFVFRHVLTRRTPMGRKEMLEVRSHGGPAMRVHTKDLLGRGIERIEERFAGVHDGRPQLANGRVLDVANVVWCTGFRQVFDWIQLPVIGEDGWPREYRGVVEDCPGLFFCGLSFQYAMSSMVLPGVSRDAAHVVHRIVERRPAPAAVPA